MTPPTKTERTTWAPIMAALVVLYLVGIGVIVLVGVNAGGSDSGSSTSEAKTLNISLTEYAITGDLTAAPGDITLNVTNAGTMDHNLSVTGLGKATQTISQGKSEKLSLGNLKAGTYELYCAIPGHKDSGMVATLTVAEGASSSAATASPAAEKLTPEQYLARDEKMMAQMKTFATDAVKTKGEGNTTITPTVQADGTKLFELTAEVVKWEVEPGKIVDAWTYNGQVPGPWIKVNLGDKVAIKITNKTPESTDIHFHGIHTPNSFDGVSPYTQQMIKPGSDFTYAFVADKPATGMYHAHMHGEEAVPNGMFGAFQIGELPFPTGRTISGVAIPANLVPVKEMPMVLNDAGTIGFSLNGKSFPSTAPVVVKQGDWFEVHYYNEGLQNHPMHMHGFPQLVIAKDGIPLDQPYWADTILMGPGERYSVLVHATDIGTWVWHCHILNHVEQKDRLFGMATAVVVQDPNKAA